MQLKRLWSILTALFVGVISPLCFSHPGHGTTEPTSPAHAAEPVHLLPVVLLSGVIALGGFSILRRFKQARERK